MCLCAYMYRDFECLTINILGKVLGLLAETKWVITIAAVTDLHKLSNVQLQKSHNCLKISSFPICFLNCILRI